MWWGRGDSSKLTEDEKKTLSDLRRLEETGHLTTLDPGRSGIGVRAVDFYGQWESIIRTMTSVKNIALLVGAILAIYWASEGAAVDWIKHIAGVKP